MGAVHIDTMRIDKLPRMADFAKLMVATEPGLGWEEGTFLRAYGENRRQATEAVFEADPVAEAIRDFVTTKHLEAGWQGTATELLAELNQAIAEDVRKSRFWPQKVNALGNAVDRAAPLLRQKGINVTKRATGRERLIILTAAG